MVDDKISWARQPLPKRSARSIFLAGPTPRDKFTRSWRSEAIQTLRNLGWTGWIIAPEPILDKEGFRCANETEFEYKEQIEWEEAGLSVADSIMFWIPRELQFMPGFTTNVEFGMWCKSGKIVLGAPSDAPKMSYLFYYAKKLGIPNARTLQATAKSAIIVASK